MSYEARIVAKGCYTIEDWDYGHALCRVSFLSGFYESMIETGLMSENDLQSIANEFMAILVKRIEQKRGENEGNTSGGTNIM